MIAPAAAQLGGGGEKEFRQAERRGTLLYKAPPAPPALSVRTHLIFSKLRDLFCDAVISPVLFLLV